MSFTPLLDHLYTFVSAVRVSFYFKTDSTYGDQLQRIRINITEVKFENQWYSYNTFINILNTTYGYTTELAQTLVYQLTNTWGMGWEVFATDNTNSNKYGNANGLLNCDIKLGDTVQYGSNGNTFTVRRISASILIKLMQKLKGSYTAVPNKEFTYNLEFTPTRIYIYREVINYLTAEQTSYQVSYEKYKTINVTNFGVTDLGTYTDLHNAGTVADMPNYYTLPEDIVACIPIGNRMSKMTTEVYMKILSGSSSNVGGTYRYDDVNFCVSNRIALCTERPTLYGDMYSSLRTYRGYGLNISSARYVDKLRTSIFATSVTNYTIHYTYDAYYVSMQDSLNFNSFINYNENDDSYSVTFTHTHRVSSGSGGSTLPSNALVCSIYVEGTLIDTFFASEDTRQYTYTFNATGDRKSISALVVYNANTTLSDIDNSCSYTKTYNYTSKQYLLVHTVDTGTFAFKVEDSNVFIGNTSRYAEGMICVKGLAVNTARKGYGIRVGDVLLFPDLNDKTRFSKALIIDDTTITGTDLADVSSKIEARLSSSEYELEKFTLGFEYNLEFMFVALYKHPQFYNGGTYEAFANTLT